MSGKHHRKEVIYHHTIYLILYICQSSVHNHKQADDYSTAAVPNHLIHVFTKTSKLRIHVIAAAIQIALAGCCLSLNLNQACLFIIINCVLHLAPIKYKFEIQILNEMKYKVT